jgi:hypothetical protein
MAAIAALVERIARQTEVPFRPCAPEDLAALRDLGAPPALLELYRDHEPAGCAELHDARLWPAADLVEENTRFVPGADLHPRGIFVVGTTLFGDTYCIDTRPNGGGQVILMSHDVSWPGVSDTQLDQLRVVVADSYAAFLTRFAEADLPLNPIDTSS